MRKSTIRNWTWGRFRFKPTALTTELWARAFHENGGERIWENAAESTAGLQPLALRKIKPPPKGDGFDFSWR